MPNHAHRGRDLERAQLKVLKAYRAHGIHCHANHALRRPDGKVVEGEPYDFEALYHGTFYAWDTKETRAGRWPLPTKTQLLQVKQLLDVEKHGGQGFFLVLFVGPTRIVRYNAQEVADAIAAGKSSLGPDDGQEATLDVCNAFTSN